MSGFECDQPQLYRLLISGEIIKNWGAIHEIFGNAFEALLDIISKFLGIKKISPPILVQTLLYNRS